MQKIVFIILAFVVCGCSYLYPLNGESRVENDFFVCLGDERLLCKGDSLDFAKKIEKDMEASIIRVQNVHGKKFTKPISIHICDTTKCFDKYTGYGEKIVAGVGSNGLFLSPLAFENDQHLNLLTHELSHLHLFQQISLLDASFIPQWFHDGHLCP